MPSTRTKLKGGKLAGKASTKIGKKAVPYAGKGAWRLGKAEAKLAKAALESREPKSARYLKYGLFLAAGIAIGALIKRNSGNGSDIYGSSQDFAPQGHSRPNEGPLAGSGGGLVSEAVVPEQQEEVEQRIRSVLGQDDRTKDMPRPNVTVNDGVAELRGPAPSEEAKRAAEEIASGVEGVREVRNLLVVSAS